MSTNNDNVSSDSPPSKSESPPPPEDSKNGPPPPSSSSHPPPNKAPPPPKDKNSPPPPSNKNSPPSSDKNHHPSNNNNDKSQTSSKSDSGSNNGNNFPPPPPPPPPPPGSPGALAPPKANKSPPPPRGGSNHSSSNEKAIIGGVAGGVGLLLLVLVVCLVACARRRKRKKRDERQYYRDNSHANQGSDYYNNGGWPNSTQSNEYALKMPPSAQVSSEYGWPVQPPPPPPPMTSSELGSTNFSGPRQHALPPPHPSMALGFNQSSFTYEDLASATGGFSSANLLGQGGFGYVHKGVLPNGKEVAVKSLKSNSGQGEREFQAEVDIISRVHHRHLVSLVGYCITGSQRMLVYEFVSNNTLEYHLHGTGRPIMDWPTRVKIALGSAKGFAYLHEDCHPRIIHRDIKVANILLDENFDAQVADFGLAKLSSDTNTHVSTRIMGTFGYLAPEYASSGKLTEKSDVYSFGVVLLELITGKRPVDIHTEEEDTLVDWARPVLSRAIDEGKYEEIADKRLLGDYDPQEMLAMIACAAACTRHSGKRRPKMSQIVRALEGDMSIDALTDGIKPGNSTTFGYSSGSEHGSQTDLKKLSNEHGTTGEFLHSR